MSRTLGRGWLRCTALAALLALGTRLESQDAPEPEKPAPTGWRAFAVPVSEPDFRCPVQPGATVMQGNFGSFSHQTAFAWDYAVPVGTPITAARSGEVILCRTDSNIGGADERFRNDANEVRVKHTDGTVSVYAHLSKNASLVRVGEFVLQGEIIAYSGTSGYSTTPHLHYEVMRDDKSVASKFSDYSRNEGVPREGDRHDPPAAPAVPQPAILALKKLHRAAVVAEQRAWPDVGLALLQDLPAAKAIADYHYLRVLREQQAAFRAAADAEIARLSGAPVAAFPDALLVKRFQVALAGVAELRPALASLAAAEKAFPDPLKKAFAGAGGAMSALVEGMRLECFEEIFDSGGKYMACRQAARGDLRAESLRCVQRLIDVYLNRSVTELIRLKDEAERALPEHHPVIRADGERVWKLCSSLFGYQRDYFPERKASTDRDLKVVSYFIDRIRKQTK